MSLEGVGTPNIETSSGESSQTASTANSALARQVFGLFKDYLSTQLDAKEKKIETKQKIDKETVELKFKGNQKQFKLNAELDSIVDQIQTANAATCNEEIVALVTEGRKLIHKRQKLIKIADKNKDGWQVVEEYESNELASNSDDEKKIKKAREAASRKERLSMSSSVSTRSGRGLVMLVGMIISFFVIGLLTFTGILCDFSVYSARVSILTSCNLMSVHTGS